jgi:tetratricopeptide (TPR) repeat protein
MLKRWLAAALIGVLLVNVAWAQRTRGGSRARGQDTDEGLQVGDYAPSIEAKEWLNVEREGDVPSLTELRGMVVVLFFWVSWHDGGEHLLPYVNMIANSPRMGRAGGVYMIGVTDANRRTTQPLIEEAKVFFPVAVESDAAEEYGFAGGLGFVVVDAEGRIAFKGSGQGNVDAMSNAITESIEESPPTKTHPKEAKVCYRRLDEAYEHTREEKYGKAYKAVRDAAPRAVLGDRLMSQMLELADLLEQLGYDRLAGLKPLLERKKYDQAADLLRLVIRRFRGLDCYKDAKQLYEDLQEEDEDFKRAADKFKDEDAAALLYLEARDDLKERRFTDSYDRLNKIVTDYSETEAAEYAEAMIDRMRSNRAFWALVLDHQTSAECQQLIARARNLIRRGRAREAEELLRRVMSDYPETIWAEEAKELLKTMP